MGNVCITLIMNELCREYVGIKQ